MPDSRDVHIDVPLSNMVIGFEPAGLISDLIYPVVPVGKQSDKYFVWQKGDFFRIPKSTLRAKKTKGTKIEYNVSCDSYFANNYALRDEEAFEDMVNEDIAINGREKTMRSLKNTLMLDKEVRVANQITSGSNLGSYTTLSGTSQWSDFTNSDPVSDVEIGQESIRSTTGKDANVMIIGRRVYNKLKNHPDMLERIKYVQKGVVTRQNLAEVFDIPLILVGNAIKNTGDEGLDDSFSDVWGDNVVLAHIGAGADADGRDPSLGYAFQWTNPVLGVPWAAEVWNDPDGGLFENRRVQYHQSEKITAGELGYLIAGAVA